MDDVFWFRRMISNIWGFDFLGNVRSRWWGRRSPNRSRPWPFATTSHRSTSSAIQVSFQRFNLDVSKTLFSWHGFNESLKNLKWLQFFQWFLVVCKIVGFSFAGISVYCLVSFIIEFFQANPDPALTRTQPKLTSRTSPTFLQEPEQPIRLPVPMRLRLPSGPRRWASPWSSGPTTPSSWRPRPENCSALPSCRSFPSPQKRKEWESFSGWVSVLTIFTFLHFYILYST